MGNLFRTWQTCARELEELDRTEQEKLRMLDLWRFQRQEIESAALKLSEEAELENERAVLRNVGRLQESANAGYAALYDAPQSAAAQVRTTLKRLEEVARIDAGVVPLIEMLRPAEIAMSEAAGELRSYLDRLEADPERLDQVESRLALIDRLKRKYGSTVEEILRFVEHVRSQIDAIENASERRAKLDVELKALARSYEEAAGRLTGVRAEAARKLASRVERELKALAMDGSVFRIALSAAKWSERGVDRIEFLLSANPGEEPKPLDRIASGGELSRIALGLKTCIGPGSQGAGGPRTLVFDEVDAGIGGGVAEAVGRRLKRLSGSNQVICVTHLAQIASFADHHYLVVKREASGRTIAEIEELTGEARTHEIARMLSGQRVTPEALKHAEQLIQIAESSLQ